jgi:hypothetical protein
VCALPPLQDRVLAHLIGVYEPRDGPTNEQGSYLPLKVGEPTDPGNQQVQLSRPDHRSH